MAQTVEMPELTVVATLLDTNIDVEYPMFDVTTETEEEYGD